MLEKEEQTKPKPNRKKEIIRIRAWMELESQMLSEISQRQIPYYFTDLWNLKTKQTKNRSRLINTENNWWLPEEKGKRARQNR